MYQIILIMENGGNVTPTRCHTTPRSIVSNVGLTQCLIMPTVGTIKGYVTIEWSDTMGVGLIGVRLHLYMSLFHLAVNFQHFFGFYDKIMGN